MSSPVSNRNLVDKSGLSSRVVYPRPQVSLAWDFQDSGLDLNQMHHMGSSFKTNNVAGQYVYTHLDQFASSDIENDLEAEATPFFPSICCETVDEERPA